jgi:hypothetical protein
MNILQQMNNSDRLEESENMSIRRELFRASGNNLRHLPTEEIFANNVVNRTKYERMKRLCCNKKYLPVMKMAFAKNYEIVFISIASTCSAPVGVHCTISYRVEQIMKSVCVQSVIYDEK